MTASERDAPSAFTSSLKRFQPKFDVTESKENYELHGELPGIEQKDVNIEFTDAQTLVIKGQTEQVHEQGQRPSGLLEGQAEQNKITDGGEATANSHQATVEDENAPKESEELTESAKPARSLSKHRRQQRHRAGTGCGSSTAVPSAALSPSRLASTMMPSRPA